MEKYVKLYGTKDVRGPTPQVWIRPCPISRSGPAQSLSRGPAPFVTLALDSSFHTAEEYKTFGTKSLSVSM